MTALILFGAFESVFVLVILGAIAISWLVEQVTGCRDLGGRALGLPVDECERDLLMIEQLNAIYQLPETIPFRRGVS